jgi:hypothetical protein
MFWRVVQSSSNSRVPADAFREDLQNTAILSGHRIWQVQKFIPSKLHIVWRSWFSFSTGSRPTSSNTSSLYHTHFLLSICWAKLNYPHAHLIISTLFRQNKTDKKINFTTWKPRKMKAQDIQNWKFSFAVRSWICLHGKSKRFKST